LASEGSPLNVTLAVPPVAPVPAAVMSAPVLTDWALSCTPIVEK
jgi:hypothetical protein